MVTVCRQGDVLTAMQDGTLRVTYGQGRKADEIEMGEGEAIEILETCKVSGIEFLRFQAPIDRLKWKRQVITQRQRKCSENMTVLEIPDIVDPLVRDIEMRLQLRGADMKARVRQEAERLRKGPKG